MKHGKKYVESKKLIDKTKTYEVDEALKLVCDTAKAKFDETVEAHIRLGVDSRHADQQVRGAVVLPNGTGKQVRVAVFAKGDMAKAAEEAGRDRRCGRSGRSHPERRVPGFRRGHRRSQHDGRRR